MKKILLILLCSFSLQAGAQTWIQLGNPTAGYLKRNHPVTFTIDDVAYIGTGFSYPNILRADFYKYDPSNDSWTSMANFPGGARGFSYGVANNGKGYVGFGLGGGNAYLNDFWEFDPVTNNWTQLASCPGTGRRHPAMVATPGKIYVGCGDGATGNLKDWWEYDIATNVWAQKTNFPSVVRHHPYFFDINGEAYVGCGHGAGIYKDMYKYTPSTGAWTSVASIPGQGRVAGTQFSYNGKGYILSGQGEDHANLATGEFYEYDPIANSWKSLAAHPGTGRWAPGSFVIGATAYLTSGAGFGASQLDISDLWKFDLPFAVGVKDIKKSNAQVQIYPNPAVDKISVTSDMNIKSIEVHTIYGAKMEISVDKSSSLEASIDISGLSAGVYIIKLQSKDGVSSKQFTKQY